MAGEPALTGPSVEEPDAEHSVLEQEPEEPWRVLPDYDVEVPGDRLDKRGNPIEGPGVFRCHSLDIPLDGEDAPPCYNDFTWGATYRLVQNILSILQGIETSIWKCSGHHHKGEKPPLSIERIPTLPELTLAMGAGDAWLPREDDEEELEAAKNADEGSQAEGPTEKFEECLVVEPHDVADYLSSNFSSACGPLRLLTFQTRDGATLLSRRTSLLGKEFAYEVWERPAGSYEIGSHEAAVETTRLRELIAGHLRSAQKPILIDDSVQSYLIVGYREHDPEGPHEESPVEYRILDAQYGLRYATRKYNFIFDAEKGPGQLGKDDAKDRWVSAEFVEEGRGILNSYVPGPMWMALFIGDEASSPDYMKQAQRSASKAKVDEAEAARKAAQFAWAAEEERKAAEAMDAARLAAEGEEDDEPSALM